MRILVVPFLDGDNWSLVPVLEEMKRRGHEIAVYAPFPEKSACGMFSHLVPEIHPVEELTNDIARTFDVAFCANMTLQFVKLLDIYIFVYSSYVYKSDWMTDGADFLFTYNYAAIGRYTGFDCVKMAVGDPKKLPAPDTAAGQKQFLFIDSGHMPFGRSGKTQVADMLIKVARSFPEYRVVIKPRWLRGAVQQHFAHKNTEHLYDVIEARCQGEVPPNLVMLSEHRELGALVSESDVVLSLYSTAILNAMLQDKPVLILTGWDCEDKWDLRSKTTIRNMKEFFSTSGCAVDIGEVCDYLPKGLKTCERFMQEVMPYRDPAAGRIVDTMEYVHSAFLQNGVFPAPGTVRFETLKADLNPDPQRTFEQLKRERIREIMQQKLYKVSCKVTAQVDFGAYYRLLEERCPCCELTEAGFEKLGAELNRQKNECLIANGDALNGDGIDQSFYFDACFQQGMEEKILSFQQEKVRCEAVYDYYAGLIYENREERPEAVRRYVRFLTWSTARSFCKYRQEEAYNTCRPFHVIFYDYDGKNVDLQTFASLYCGFFEKKNDTYVDPAVIRWAGEKLMAHLDELKKENPELALRAAGYFYSRGGDELMEERAKQLREQQERIAALEAELATLKGSRSYKLGRMLTALPRRAKRLVRQKEK